MSPLWAACRCARAARETARRGGSEESHLLRPVPCRVPSSWTLRSLRVEREGVGIIFAVGDDAVARERDLDRVGAEPVDIAIDGQRDLRDAQLAVLAVVEAVFHVAFDVEVGRRRGAARDVLLHVGAVAVGQLERLAFRDRGAGGEEDLAAAQVNDVVVAIHFAFSSVPADSFFDCFSRNSSAIASSVFVVA